MQPQIKGHNLHIGENVRELVARKTARLDRYLPDWAVVEAKLDLHHKQVRGGDFAQAELTIATPGAVLRAESKAPELGAALESVVDRMARQIVRYRTRRRDLARQAGDRALPELPVETTALAEEAAADSAAGVLRVKHFSARPMSVEEAIEQLELVGHDFFVFTNADGAATNVLYRRHDGGYGLLQPG